MTRSDGLRTWCPYRALAAVAISAIVAPAGACSRSTREGPRHSFWLVPETMDFVPIGSAASSPVKLRDLGAYKRTLDQAVVRARVFNDSDLAQLPAVTFAFTDADGHPLGNGTCLIERSVLRPREWAPCGVSAPKDAVSAQFDIYLAPRTSVENELGRRHDLEVTRAELDSVLTPPGPGVPSQFAFSGTIAPARVPEASEAQVDVELYAGDLWVGHTERTVATDALATRGAEFSGAALEIDLVKAPTRVRATAFIIVR